MKIDPRLPQLIADNINENADRLRLKYHGNLLMQQAITQIDCRRRCATKLPEALSHSDFMFPSTIAAEQCTSEVIARFHASLIAEGETVVDMTCGLGIDTFAIARRAAAVTAIEIDEAKAECAVHNARVMGLDNVSIVDGDSVAWLNDFTGHVDTIFVDPARRDSMGKRVFGLADCLPDVTALLPRLRQVCDKVIVKASPMLDIKHTIHALEGAVTDCYVIGTTTECKELVTVLSMTGVTPIDDVMIHVVTISAGEVNRESYRSGDEEKAVPDYASPREGQMLLSPYPATLKGGSLKLYASAYNIAKIAPDCHLYLADRKIAGFPGETIEIERVLEFNKRGIAMVKREYPKINVTTHGMGLSAPELVKRLGVKEGGDLRLFGVRDADGRRLLIIARRNAEKV